MISTINTRLEALADLPTAAILRGFFKTGPGEYGEGDRFRGIRVPVLRKLCREFRHAGIEVISELLESPWHEDRMLALLLLMERYRASSESGREELYDFYCSRSDRVNNWDLVDVSCPHIVGRHLQTRDRSPLYRFVESSNLWERRIAIVSTFHFIRDNNFTDTLILAERLLADPEELLHKATGWMLREVGKRDQPQLEAFLEEYATVMPRTMLRYAIERFPEEERLAYLKKR
ncbi:DNA alkylation repair enzyme [Chlorobaculum parvum NCIB 8327]|uniref:DNA alkylation repair enzyme n=1 Tax=Chlorobaculum parvum (strain DSM 263 / NCIMB 8327) TaxID=517417 RepID=B3QMI0_CHLP8|nr:DNA alkylation repair protein [Chlorobaculum parvum]ACF11133.1 DNA alkylation repair enzyme [Chlorobaculum parvum NCIB 8327]